MSKIIFEIIAEYDDASWENSSPGNSPKPEKYAKVIENDIAKGRMNAQTAEDYLYDITQDAASWGIPYSFYYNVRIED